LKKYRRKPSEIELVREISVSIADSREEAIARYKETPGYAHKVSLLMGWGWGLSSLERVIETSLIGTVDDVIKGIQGYLDINVKHFMLNFAVTKPQDLVPAMEVFSKEIIPSF